MKLLLAGATALVLLMPVCASAQPKKPDVYLIKNGVFSCTSCTPAIKVKADNTYYPVSGSPNFDSVAVNLTGNGFTRTDRKAGKVVTTWNCSVSVDGRTTTTTFTSGKASGVIIARRTAPTPAGAHPLSGSWQMADSSGAPPPAH